MQYFSFLYLICESHFQPKLTDETRHVHIKPSLVTFLVSTDAFFFNTDVQLLPSKMEITTKSLACSAMTQLNSSKKYATRNVAFEENVTRF